MRSRRSRSSSSRSERRKMVGPNPGAILMFQSTESDGTPPKFNIAPEKWWLEDYFPIGRQLFTYIAISTRSTSAGIVPSTGRGGAHANTYNIVHIIYHNRHNDTIHVALILILILILTLILILFILIVPSSNSSYSSYSSYPSYSSYSSYSSSSSSSP